MPVTRTVRARAIGAERGGSGTVGPEADTRRRSGRLPGTTVTNAGQSPARQEKSKLHEPWSI